MAPNLEFTLQGSNILDLDLNLAYLGTLIQITGQELKDKYLSLVDKSFKDYLRSKSPDKKLILPSKQLNEYIRSVIQA